MKIGEAYSRGYRDCSTLYKGTGKWWVYLTLSLAILMGGSIGALVTYLILEGV